MRNSPGFQNLRAPETLLPPRSSTLLLSNPSYSPAATKSSLHQALVGFLKREMKIGIQEQEDNSATPTPTLQFNFCVLC